MFFKFPNESKYPATTIEAYLTGWESMLQHVCFLCFLLSANIPLHASSPLPLSPLHLPLK